MSHLEEAVIPLPILLVDDDRADVRLLRELLQGGRLGNPLHVVEDGPEALEFLFRTGRYASAPRPGLILLDLNLPQLEGREVLARIKNDAALRDIPVIILTNSEEDAGLLNTYGRQATRYMTKPMSFSELLAVIQTFEDLAFVLVRYQPRKKEELPS